MIINNVAQNVPDQVKEIFEGFLPFGSDYVMYCDTYGSASTGLRSYTCMFRPVGGDEMSVVRVYNQSNSGWAVSDVSTRPIEQVSVSFPYYCYSNLRGQGRYTVSTSGQNIVPFMLIVICSIMVLKTVFGGIKLWSARS